MSSFAIPLPVLSLAAGPILFLVAQSNVVQFETSMLLTRY
jgi:hypothetical protein